MIHGTRRWPERVLRLPLTLWRPEKYLEGSSMTCILQRLLEANRKLRISVHEGERPERRIAASFQRGRPSISRYFSLFAVWGRPHELF